MMIFAIHAPNPEKLIEITAEMQERGAPAIKVVNCGDYYMALEGSHRIAAAHKLGLKPELVIYEQDEVIEIENFDWFDAAIWADTKYPAGEVASELFAPSQALDYSFE
jgi:hypothetical protein